MSADSCAKFLAEQQEGEVERWQGVGGREKNCRPAAGSPQLWGDSKEPEDCKFKHGLPGFMKAYLSRQEKETC